MTPITEIIQSPIFAKQKKKLHKQPIRDLDKAVESIRNDPSIGEMKVGDLKGVRVHKYTSKNQQVLLAYEVVDTTLFLYAFGSHENFYLNLKRQMRG